MLMIQRVQSAYLFVAAVLCFVIPVTSGWITPDGWAWYAPVRAVLSILVGVGALVAIFLYGDRSRQKVLVSVDTVLSLGLFVFLLVSSWMAGPPSVGSLWPLLLPLAACVLLVLARRAIARDIDLVRSMDRLR